MAVAKPILFFAFAPGQHSLGEVDNDHAGNLRELARERDELHAAFRAAEADGRCEILSLYPATPAGITETFLKYRGRIRVFHYGGHSDADELFLHKDYPEQTGTRAYTLAGFLATQPGLELVFLNGCLNLAQAEAYHRAGVRTVIATDRPVGDRAARAFAQLVYQALAGRATISEAYRSAATAYELRHGDPWRGFLPRKTVADALPWQLFPPGDHPWRLPLATKYLTSVPDINLERDFLGRARELGELTEMLDRTARVVLVNGLGGIGKTVLATAYAQTHGGDYDHLAWINRGEDLVNAFALNTELADNLGVPFETDEDLPERFRRILRRLQQLPGRNLLVIDNAQEQVAQREVYDLLPGPPHWRVLLTSRMELAPFDRLRLDTLAPEAAKALFRRHFQGPHTEAELVDLLEEIGYHTLTIELLARLLDKSNLQLTLAKLTAALREKQLEDAELDQPVWSRHSFEEQSIFRHLMKAFHLSKLEEKEQWLLKQFVALPVEPYPVEMLADFLAEKPLALNKVLNSLAAKGWLTLFEDKRFGIHRLVRQVVEYQLRPGYADLEVLVGEMSRKMAQDSHTNPVTDNFPWIRFAEAVLNFLSKGQNERMAKLQLNLALVYTDLGEYTRARELLEAALAFAKNHFGPNHPNVATSQSNLAKVYSRLGDYTRARELLEATRFSDLKNFGPGHPSVARSQSILAAVYRNLGEYTRARDVFQAVLASDLKNFGPDHPTVAISRNNLALVCSDLGEYARARELLEAALASDLKNFEPDHPEVAKKQSNLALVYKELGEYVHARDLLETALASDLKNFGPDHPTVAISRNNLALVCSDLGEFTRAGELLEATLASDLNNFGSDHPDVARSRSNLALVYADLGDYTRAGELLEAALASDLKNFGPDHPTVAKDQSNLALVYKELRVYARARTLFESALASAIKNFGLNHPNVATYQSNLGLVHQELGEYARARELLEAALASDLENFGPDHLNVAVRYNNLAYVLIGEEKWQEAKTHFELALRIVRQLWKEDHPNIQRTKRTLEWVIQKMEG